MTGRVHSLQSLGTVDGPGIRFVVFMQGCNLRCGCCHNPDTRELSGADGCGVEYDAEEIVRRAARCREYFGADGGITVSGGEPLLQADFVREVFARSHAEGINTCLDTSGSILGESVLALLEETDRVLLDIKYTTDELYRENVGCTLERVLNFLRCLDGRRIPVTLRQVIIPTKNDDEENILALGRIALEYPCVDKIELLPFRKVCRVKYDMMGIKFPFADIPEPSKEKLDELRKLLPMI